MAIIDTIMSTPVDVNALSADGAPVERQLDGAFSNLVNYSRKNWSYTASSRSGGDALMNGSANAAPCGGIATALKKVFIDGLGVSENDIEYIRVTGYVWTGPTYACFDPKVKGNLRTLDSRDYRNGCIFNEHYYLRAAGKFYDPCLSTAYTQRDQSIKEKFDAKLKFSVGPGMGRTFLVTKDRRTAIFYMPTENVPGFTGAYAMFDCNKKSIEKALGKAEFKTEMKVRGGNTEFARFVQTLR